MTVLLRHSTGTPQKSLVGRTSRSRLRIFVAHPWLSTAPSGRSGLYDGRAAARHGETFCDFSGVCLFMAFRAYSETIGANFRSYPN